MNPYRISNSSSFFIRAENPNTSKQAADSRFLGLFTTLYAFFRIRSTISIDLDVKKRLEDIESGDSIGDKASSSHLQNPSRQIFTEWISTVESNQ
jgi:hypothetical protein